MLHSSGGRALERTLTGVVIALLAMSVVAAAQVATPTRSTPGGTRSLAAGLGPVVSTGAALAWGDRVPAAPDTLVAATTPVATTTSQAAPPPTVPAARAAGTPRGAAPVPAPTPGNRSRPKPRPPAEADLAPYAGLGTWVDVYDWTQTYTRDGAPAVDASTVERMAREGVQTLYIQASKHDAPTDVLEPERLLPIIDEAHRRGLKVVAWYLPSLVDPARDLERLLAIAALDVDGLAVDIEARNVRDVQERNRRLVRLCTDLRTALPGRTLGAQVLPPVVLEEVNKAYWPDFPYRELAPLIDVWQTMGYWTNRKQSSGWRNAYAYTVENVVRLRRNLGLPDAPVHPIGGIGDQTTPADVEGFERAATDTHSIGGSLYDWRTTRADSWPGLRAFRT